MCGHATLASGHVVLSQNPDMDRVTFRTRQVGILEVRREGEGYAVALPTIPSEPMDFADAVKAVGGSPTHISGNPNQYYLLRYASADEIWALKPDMKTLATLGNDLFVATAPGDETDIVSRVFVPGAGIDEDAVTGSAHALLAPYWAAELGRDNFTAHQASARGGYLGCQIEDDRVWLSGRCFTVVEGRFRLS